MYILIVPTFFHCSFYCISVNSVECLNVYEIVFIRNLIFIDIINNVNNNNGML